MSDQKFQAGNVVRLKSGGPKMTVVNHGKYDYGEDMSYKCKWFDDKNKLLENTFTEEELELVTTNPSASFSIERA